MLVFQDDETVDKAVKVLKADGSHQPLLYRLHRRYYIKSDYAVIPITEQSIFADAVDLLFMCFFVFSVR